MGTLDGAPGKSRRHVRLDHCGRQAKSPMNQNFKDPVGLAWRMLRSGNATARSILVREAFELAIKPVDWLMSPIERRHLRRALRRNPSPRQTAGPTPMLLVVGGPRSGTTIAYQLLAAHLPVSYTSSWIDAFARSPITAGRLRRRWVLDPPRTRENYFGSVAGLGGPNDAFALWNRWFGKVRGKPKALTPDAIEDMRAFFAAWHQTFGRPLLNKNNRNTLAIDQLTAALPGARFVVVRRDPVYVAQSLIESRRRVQGDVNAGWGLLSRDADPNVPLDYVHVVCEQVHAFQKQLTEQLDSVDPDHYMQLDYRDLCSDPQGAIHAAFRLLWPGETELAIPKIDPLNHTDQDRLSTQELDEIRHWFANLKSTAPTPLEPVVKPLDDITRSKTPAPKPR